VYSVPYEPLHIFCANKPSVNLRVWYFYLFRRRRNRKPGQAEKKNANVSLSLQPLSAVNSALEEDDISQNDEGNIYI